MKKSKTLELVNNDIDDSCIESIAKFTLEKKLDLSDNKITVVGAIKLAESSKFEKLILRNNPIIYNENQKAQFERLITAFINNKSIKILDLNSCEIPSQMIANIIKNNNTISIFYAPKNLEDSALEFIEKNTSLKTLYLGRSQLTDLSISYLVKNNSLSTITFDESNITDKGIQLLSQHPSLQELEIRESNITTTGLEYFFSSNIKRINIFTDKKVEFLSKNDAWDFVKKYVIYSSQKEKELKLENQQKYYQQLNLDNKYVDINPNMNNYKELQEAIDYIQYKESHDLYFNDF